jgi:pseudoazurin
MKLTLLATVAALAAGTVPALAADYEVQMLNRGTAGGTMVFEPAYLAVEPGDTVTFVATDRGHNAEIISGMLPEGAEPFRGRMGQPLTVTFGVPGVYGYKCLPHMALGMVGVIVVGDPAGNLETARAAEPSGKAGQVMDGLLAQAAP